MATPTPTLDEEKQLWNIDFYYVCGIDEVGRGAFAGPVVAGAVIFPKNFDPKLIPGVADSKLLSPKTRDRISELIKKHALDYAVGEISVVAINKFGIGKATQMAMRKAIARLSKGPDFVLIDAFYIPYVKNLRRKNQKAIKKGDMKVVSIAAASIIAKVYRDKLMQALSTKHKVYGWGRNKGYGTKEHQEAIKKHGLTRLHRKVFCKGLIV